MIKKWRDKRNRKKVLDIYMGRDTQGSQLICKITLMAEFGVPYDKLTFNEQAIAFEAALLMQEFANGFGMSADEASAAFSKALPK